MPKARFPRGSEWRRWDLQVHTPLSVLNNGFGQDMDEYAKTLFEAAVEKGVAVVGITDYFSVDGYKVLTAIKADKSRLRKLVGAEVAEKAQNILLLPNIELRSSVLIDGDRVNYHVIFSDTIDADVIENDFLRELKFTAESNPDSEDERWSLTASNLERLGQELKKQHLPFQSETDLFVGMVNAVVAHEDVTGVLTRQLSRFGDRFILAVPIDEDLSKCKWDGQGHLSRKLFIQKSHMLFSSNGKTRDFGLGLTHRSQQEFKEEFKTLKPCIHGSDAHTIDQLFEPADYRYLWIKADPTFYGLQQLLYEPADRVFIGRERPFQIQEKENATRYISAVSFERTELAQDGEFWFSGSLPLNHGLVAIIGKKGSGKSALADILGLLGNSRRRREFSFLTRDRFLNPKENLGEKFRATIGWMSGAGVTRLLSDPVKDEAPELVKYIPQNYLEQICSDLKESRASEFNDELMDVIFSHVAAADRLGMERLADLIDYLTSEKEEQISQLAAEIEAVNGEVAALEDRLLPEYRKTLEEQLGQKRSELGAHDEARPQEVSEPSSDENEQKATKVAKDDLAKLVKDWKDLDTSIAASEREMGEVALKIVAVDRLVARIDNLQRQLAVFHADSEQDAQRLAIDTHELVSLLVDRKPILDVKTQAERRRAELQCSLDPNADGSLRKLLDNVKVATEAARAKLDEPNRRYQEYLRQFSEWSARREQLAGVAGAANSVLGLEEKLRALDAIPGQVAHLKEKRLDLVREVIGVKKKLLEDYERLYSPVQEFIDNHPVSQEQGGLEFTASIAVDEFAGGLLKMLHQGRKGSFMGEQEGRARIEEVLAQSNFSSAAGIEGFLDTIEDYLAYDRRPGYGEGTRLRDQLLQGVTPKDVYDFLYKLSFMKPRFELRWQGKAIDQLSPGERGNLLLIFYLLIDKRTVPLIIDQPEENLDNQSVVTMLVPAVKHAKKHRQVILVTHNPNLAVVCDADQIIHADLDKTNGCRVTYTCGAIEEPVIAQLIVDVLEGTLPAFDMRDAKYRLLEH